jgi:hypothetical protein
MAAWKAGKEWNDTPGTTTSLDDLRDLIDLRTQGPEKSFDDTFQPTLTRALTDKAALKVVFGSPPATTKLEWFSAVNSTSNNYKEVLDDSSAALIPELSSPESEVGDVFSRLRTNTEPAGPDLSDDTPPIYQEATDSAAAPVSVKSSYKPGELDDIVNATPQTTQIEELDELTCIAYWSPGIETVVNGPPTPGIFEPATSEGGLQELATTPYIIFKSESNAVVDTNARPASHTIFTKRLPTLEEVLESLLHPSSEAAILEACGAVTTEPVQNSQFDPTMFTLPTIVQTSPTPPPAVAPLATEPLRSPYTKQETEAIDRFAVAGSAWRVSKSPPEPIIAIYIENIASNEAVLDLFKQEDREKIIKVGKWKKLHMLAHFKTVQERDAAFTHLPDELKSGIAEDRSRPSVTIFEHKLYAPSNNGTAASSEPSTEETAELSLDEFASCTLLPMAAERKFTLFTKLPEKLRKKIWQHARPERRVIQLCVSLSAKSIISTAPVPALLHVCRESRTLAQTWYEFSFSSLEFRMPKVYFDFTRDGIYTHCGGCLGSNCTHKLTWTKDHERVKLLAFEAPMSFKPFRKIARQYPGVEELILIKGKSMVPGGQIPWEAFEKVNERFSWQDYEHDLVVQYRRLLIENEPLLAKDSRLRKIQRMTLPGVVETAGLSPSSGKGMWTCCQ